MKLSIKLVTLAASAVALLNPISSRAVMFVSTSDPNYNSTAPGGALANSGWQWQGLWGGFLGTPIAPQYFIAARHVGGSVGQNFVFNGVAYTTVAFFDSPTSDLRIWKISGEFPAYAPLYTGNGEVGKSMVVFGRGTQAGTEVYSTSCATNVTYNVIDIKAAKIDQKTAKAMAASDPLASLKGNTLKMPVYTVTTNNCLAGWRWGKSDGVVRWGENRVTSAGDFLVSSFNPALGPNVCHLSGGDSSGAVFIQDGATWKLAGINYGVEGPFSTNPNEAAFQAAIFDKSGLFQGSYQYPTDGTIKPSSFYATRISSNLSWILSVINQ